MWFSGRLSQQHHRQQLSSGFWALASHGQVLTSAGGGGLWGAYPLAM